MLRHFKLAIQRPYLIKDIIYKKHLGIILCCNIPEYISINKTNKVTTNQCEIQLSSDVVEIYDYYQKMGRSSITKEKIKEWLENGHHCWTAKLNNKVVGGIWIFFGQVKINTLSARVLSEDKTIVFDDGVGYQGYVLIDSDYRRQGIYSSFNEHIINYYYNEGKIKYILLITGASNGAVIRTIMNSYGKLIGIVEVKNIMGKVTRKELFIDKKGKIWR